MNFDNKESPEKTPFAMKSNEPWSKTESSNDSSPLVVVGLAVNEAGGIPPPPPSSSDAPNQWETLPPGWASAYSPRDERVYYWEISTGRTTWTHPMMQACIAAPPTSSSQNVAFVPTGAPLPRNNRNVWGYSSENRTDLYDTPLNATRRPNNHQCYAMAALILCFPIGLCAIYQSCMVDRSWSHGNYGNAVNHSRQATQYACFGTALGTAFWIWFFLSDKIVQMADWFQFD